MDMIPASMRNKVIWNPRAGISLAELLQLVVLTSDEEMWECHRLSQATLCYNWEKRSRK